MAKTFKLGAFLVALILLSDPALAQDFTPVTTALNQIVGLLTGAIGRAVAIIGVVGVGFLWMTGRMAIGPAMTVIGGVVLIFGAATIVDGLAP